MADEMTMGLNVNLTVEGTDELKNVLKTIEKMQNKIDLQKFYSKGSDELERQSEMVNKVLSSYKRYSKVESKDNAAELVKSVNALKALKDSDLTDLNIQGFDKILDSLKKAQELAGNLTNGFSVSDFKEAFSAFDTLKKGNIDLGSFFEKMSNPDIEQLNLQLTETANRLAEVNSENDTLREKLENAENGNGFKELNKQIDELHDNLESLRIESVQLFEAFMEVNQLSTGNLDISNLYDLVSTGEISAQEAIYRIKKDGDLSKLLNPTGEVDLTQLASLTSKLDAVSNKIDEVSAKIKEISDEGVKVNGTLTEGSNGLGQLINTLQGLSSDNGASEEIQSLYGALANVLTIIKDIGNIEGEANLNSLYGIISNLSDLNGLDIDKTSLNTLKDSLFEICQIENPSALNSLALVKWNSLSELKVSKASMDNLATYLPQIAGVNAGKLLELSQIDFSNLNNFNVDKEALANLKAFAKSLKGIFQGDELQNPVETPTDNNNGNIESATNAKENFSSANADVQNSIDASIPKLTSEASAFDEVTASAKEAAKAKEEFAAANNELNKNTDDTTPALQSESIGLAGIREQIKDSFQGGNDDNVIGTILPTDSDFNSVLDNLDLTESKLKDIVKIVEKGRSDNDGKFYKSFILTDKNGSTETYGESSNTDKGQLLNSSYVKYDAKAAEQAEKAFNSLWDEAEKINNTLDNTADKISDLSKMPELSSQFSESFGEGNSKLTDLNSQLTSGEISVSDYNKQVGNLVSTYNSLVKIEQARQKYTYDEDAKAAEQAEKTEKERAETLEKINTQYDKLSNRKESEQSDIYKIDLAELEQAKSTLDKLKDIKIDAMTAEELSDYKAATKAATELLEKFKNMSAADKGSTDLSRAKLLLQITQYMEKNTIAANKYKEQFSELTNTIRDEGANANVADLTKKFSELKTQISEAGETGKSFWDVLKDKVWYQWAAQLGSFFGFNDIRQTLQSAVETIIDLDTALVDLKKTTTMNTTELNAFYSSSNDVAKQMGATTEEIIEQASSWSRLGYSTGEAATQMSELSAQFDAISPDMDIDTATNGLVSTMAAFNLGVDDVKDGIMSKINAIGNAFATSNGEIIEGLEKDAASMNAANNSLEQTIALFTSGVEITRDAESMGSALKTISMRIRGYDEETEELSEEYENLSGDIADLTKTASTQGGISLFTDETKETYKSTYQILKEISQIWDELSDKNQAELLEKLFAKTRANQGAAIISNFSQAEKAIEVMENSAGSADAELETYTQSIEYKLNRLTETWTGTWQNLIDRGTIGTVVDSLTSVSEALGWVIDNVGLLGAAGIGLGTLITKNNVGREKCYPSVDMPTIVKLPV